MIITGHIQENDEWLCEECGEPVSSADKIVEAYEVTGRFLCDECADAEMDMGFGDEH